MCFDETLHLTARGDRKKGFEGTKKSLGEAKEGSKGIIDLFGLRKQKNTK